MLEEGFIRRQCLVADTRIAHIAAEKVGIGAKTRQHVVQQYVEGNIAQVFLRNALQQVETAYLRLLGTQTGHKVGDDGMIATRSHQDAGSSVLVQTIQTGKLTCLLVGHESGGIGIADRVFVCQTAVVLGALLGRYFGQVGAFSRRHDVQIDGKRGTRLFIELHLQLTVLAEREFGKACLSAFRCPHQHIALAGSQRGLAFGIGLLAGYGIKFGIVIEFELDNGIGHRLASGVYYLHHGTGCRGVIVYHIDFRIAIGHGHYFFGAFVASEHLGVHQHSPAGWGVEPSQVEYGLGLAGSQEVPLAVSPGLYPGMIVVGVRPTGRIDLTRRYAYRTQSGHQQGRLFAATAISRTDSSHRRTGAGIAWLIDGLLVTPVVHFEDGVVQRKLLHAVFQFLIKYDTCTVQMLVVHPRRKHKVTEQLFGNIAAPGHFVGCLTRCTHVHQVEFARIIGNVGQGHVGIKKLQCLALVRVKVGVEHGKQVALRHLFLFQFQVLFYLGTVFGIFDKMGIAARCKQARQQ